MPKRIRFGLQANYTETPQELAEIAKKAEDLGYDTLLFPDHMNRQGSPLLMCLHAANATTRLRVGTQVIANDFRPPVMLAKEVATIDMLTGGRFELGIGTGWPATSATGQSDNGQLGLPLDEPGPRVGRLGESLKIIKQFMSSTEPFDFDGKLYSLKRINPIPRPVQQPRPPIMLAGAGPRMLRLGAREADIINIAPRPPTVGPTAVGSMGYGLTIEDELDIIKEAAGARFDDLELAVYADRLNTTDDVATARAKIAEGMKTSVEVVAGMPHMLVGDAQHMIDQINQARGEYNIGYRIIPFTGMEAMAPVVKRLAGT
jgi:probable F420-dependent oxidoreductase